MRRRLPHNKCTSRTTMRGHQPQHLSERFSESSHWILFHVIVLVCTHTHTLTLHLMELTAQHIPPITTHTHTHTTGETAAICSRGRAQMESYANVRHRRGPNRSVHITNMLCSFTCKFIQRLIAYCILCVDVRQPDLRTLRHTSTRARPSRLYTSHRKIYYNSPLRAMLAICAETCTFLHPRPKSISRRFAKIHFERLLILSLHTHARKQTRRHTCRCTPFLGESPVRST